VSRKRWIWMLAALALAALLAWAWFVGGERPLVWIE
jgi:hypothetical protein